MRGTAAGALPLDELRDLPMTRTAVAAGAA
jgi:hypothetical protein